MTKPCWIVALLVGASAFAEEEAIDFNRDIRPILSENCYHCHGPDGDARKADLRLDMEDATRADLGGYVAITPGDLEKSEAWTRITHEDPDELMPPPDSNRALNAKQKDLLRRWILEGAKFEKHWAYVNPERPEVAEGVNPLDYFIQKRLEKNGLASSPRADKRTLIRRVSFDLTGLPPTLEEVENFLSDESPDAFEKVLDRLLQSERYGEHWARAWLDLARYADSNGFQADQIRDSWAYRDWVIDALNSNMPFDQFTIEQLAGDLLPDATVSQKIATGFHRTVPCNVEAGVHPEENRVNQVIDRVNTTGTVWLGTTLECAQCHDHKFDPFTMKDYYGIFAYFNQTPVEVRNPSGKGVGFDFYGPKMDLPMSSEKSVQRESLTKQIEELEKKKTELAKAGKQNRSKLEEALRKTAGSPPKWKVLKITSFKGTGGETFKDLGDGSILVTGPIPDTSTYMVTGSTDLKSIRAVKLEMLTHPTLSANGPARGNGDRPNVVLNEARLEIRKQGGDFEEVALSNAVSDFSQQSWDASGAIDGDRKSGWAINPQFGKDHWLRFNVDSNKAGSPPETGGRELRLTLEQLLGDQRVMGRLRISVTADQPLNHEIDAELLSILNKPGKSRSRDEKLKLDTHFEKANPALKKVEQQLKQANVRLKAVEPDSTLIMVEVDKPRETHVMKRGNYLDKGEQVAARTPEFLHPISPDLPQNRLGFSKWLTNPENPLMARVTVNRWWARIFGRGIVRTAEDFGTQAEPPTHPELLNWLGTEFVKSGWDMKHILKLMVLSDAYAQSSVVSREMLETDPENIYLGRSPRFRMSAEMIRDNALAVSGLLSTKMHGPPIMPYQPDGLWRQVGRNEPTWVEAKDENRWRRGIYVIWRRAAPYPSFVNFDGPDRSSCVVERGRTNTPLQALTLLNDPAYTEAALALGDRILQESPEQDIDAQITHLFEIVLNRQPHSGEREHVRSLLEERMKQIDSDPTIAEKLIKGASKVYQPQSDSSRRNELASWYFIGNILLNLDETITRG